MNRFDSESASMYDVKQAETPVPKLYKKLNFEYDSSASDVFQDVQVLKKWMKLFIIIICLIDINN